MMICGSVADCRLIYQHPNDHHVHPFTLPFHFTARYYYFEVVEVYRRILFIGVLPLLATNASRRAAFGVFFSLISLTLYVHPC